MNGEMKVAVMEGIGKIGYTKRPIPTPKSNEVLVIMRRKPPTLMSLCYS